jgi:hypothetical protein
VAAAGCRNSRDAPDLTLDLWARLVRTSLDAYVKTSLACITRWVFVVCVLAAVPACDDTEVAGEARRDEPAGRTTRDGSASPPEVGCSAAITGRVDPGWRAKSVVRGRLGLYGAGTDIRTAERWGRSAFWTKVPVILAGRRPATLRVSPRDRHRGGLTYGPKRLSPATSDDGARGLAAAPRAMRFVPCQARAVTAWPGGLALADRRGIRFQVRLDERGWRSLSLPGRR